MVAVVVELKKYKDSNTVMNWLDQYKSEKTIRGYKYIVEEFFDCDIELINDWKIKSVKFSDVKKYLKGLFEQGKSDNTVKNRKAGLSSLFEYCIDMEIIRENPCNNRRVKKLLQLNVRKGEEVGISLSKDEIRELLNRIDNELEKLMIEVMVKTGVRISELVEIKFSDLVLKNNKYWMQIEGKGRKLRWVIVNEELLNKIKNYIDKNEIEIDERIFQVGVRTVDRVVKKWDNRLSAHDLRRTFITNLIKNGASINVVQQLAGHKNMATTQKYFKEYERFNEKIGEYIDW